MSLQDKIAALPEWPKPMRGMPLESAADQLDAALARLALAREILEKCRGEIERQDGYLGQLVPADGFKGPHPALADIDALLAALEPPK